MDIMDKVATQIEAYGYDKFMRMSNRARNQYIYEFFKAKTPKDKSPLRSLVNKYINAHTVTSVTNSDPKPKKSPSPKTPLKSASLKSPIITPPNDPKAKSPPLGGGGGLDTSLLPPSVQALVNLGPNLKNIPAWLGPFIIKEIEKTQYDKTTPPWTRPPIHHPIQNEAIDCILYSDKHVIMIDGSKRRGKSSTVYTAFCEAQYNNKGLKRWFLYGATEDNAAKILRSVAEDPLFYPYTFPILNGFGSTMKKTAYNGGRIEVMSSGSERRTSGTDADVIWIDESHSVLIENPKTIAMSAMVLLANTNMKIVYTMNREGEAYEYFKNEMLSKYPADDIAYFSFVEDNCPHIDAEQDKRVRTIVEASAGAEYAAQYLDNAYVRENGLYYPLSKIAKAYEPYEKPNMEQYDLITCGIDWGDSHDSSMIIMGYLDEEAYEEEMVYFQHPTTEEIERVIVRLIRDYPGIIFIWEGSPLGGFARNSIRAKYPNQRFMTSYFTKYKQSYIDNLYIWLVDENLHLKDGKLKRQLRSYKNDKKNDDGHDALAHCLYKSVTPRTMMKQEMRVINRD